MSATGTYSEHLPCGGTLMVSSSGFHIHYYFPGPDARYNGTFVDVPGEQVAAYIDAFQKNWEEFKRLSATIPSGGTFHRSGQQGMEIQVGEYVGGVYLRSYHMPIRTEAELQRVIDSYRYAQRRAAEVQALLKRL